MCLGCDAEYVLVDFADNGHIVQTRLILLDAPLILFMAVSFLCYIKFYKLRYRSATLTILPLIHPNRC